MALKYFVLKLTNIRQLNFAPEEANIDFVNLTCITNV